MEASHRILRAEAEELDRTARDLTTRELARRERIVATATTLMARHPSGSITYRALATALAMAPATLRRLFVDMDALLGEILRRHLMAVANALGQVPRDAPDRAARRRAAYMAVTRRPFGGPVEAHLLLLRDRHSLPDDVLEPLEQTRLGLGDILAPGYAAEALLLLDSPLLDSRRVEAMLAACETLGWPEAPPSVQDAAPEQAPAAPPPRARPERAAAKIFTLERHPDDVMILQSATATAALNPAARGQAPPS